MSRMRASPMARAAPWLLAGGFVALWWLERRRPLRQATEPRAPRLVRNALTGATAAAVVAAAEMPLARRVAEAAERRHFGLVRRLGLSPAAERVAGLVLLDYTLYLWHVLLHRVPALWRAHRFHHADRDLDVSTALRFHAAEMLWSVPWRLAQVAAIGVSHKTLELWGRLTLAEVMFHHSDVRLPARLERVLGWLVVTPRLHGIHHSDQAPHQRMNLSSGLAAWDVLHGTRCTNVPQAAITIGLPDAGSPRPADAQRPSSV
jgi:sterol desaturase/sphingolipid hydroxylase (fatty acid hydroxylase superfamily)